MVETARTFLASVPIFLRRRLRLTLVFEVFEGISFSNNREDGLSDTAGRVNYSIAPYFQQLRSVSTLETLHVLPS